MESREYHARIVAAGHSLKRDEDGAVDIFVCDFGHCNGPGCEVCGASWCHHCQPSIQPCDDGKSKAEYEAKKRVEAAAPDILAALKALSAVAEMTTFSDQYPLECEMAKEAILKAEGLHSPEGGDRG